MDTLTEEADKRVSSAKNTYDAAIKRKDDIAILVEYVKYLDKRVTSVEKRLSILEKKIK